MLIDVVFLGHSTGREVHRVEIHFAAFGGGQVPMPHVTLAPRQLLAQPEVHIGPPVAVFPVRSGGCRRQHPARIGTSRILVQTEGERGAGLAEPPTLFTRPAAPVVRRGVQNQGLFGERNIFG